jgi:hypothetical protein
MLIAIFAITFLALLGFPLTFLHTANKKLPTAMGMTMDDWKRLQSFNDKRWGGAC